MPQRRIPFTTVAIVVLASAFWAAIGSMAVSHAMETDFLSFYTGGWLARHGSLDRLYDADLQASVEKKLAPHAPAMMPFIRPPFYALLLAPLTLLPLVPAFWLWVAAETAALLACWWWLARRFGYDALVFCALYFPTSVGLSNGQDPVWLLAIFLASYALAEKRRDLAGGAVLGLAMVKFHLLFLMPLAMAAEKRWRMLAGFCVTAAGAAAVSVLVCGPGIVEQYYRFLTRKDIKTLDPVPVRMISIRALAWNLGLDSPLIGWALTALVVWLVLGAVRQAPLWRWMAAATTGTLLVAPHIYNYDAGILLLPILLAIFCSTDKFTRIMAATAAIPIPHMVAFFGPPWSMMPVVVMLLFLTALAWESYRERVPARAAAQAPLGSPAA